MSNFKKSIFALLSIALIASFAAAQMPTGKIVGKVTDEQGVALPGVTVEATSPRLVGTATSITDEGGTYRLLALPSGTYTITFTMPGFKQKIRKDIILQLEQTLTLNETLTQSAVAEEITVVGQSPLIDVKIDDQGRDDDQGRLHAAAPEPELPGPAVHGARRPVRRRSRAACRSTAPPEPRTSSTSTGRTSRTSTPAYVTQGGIVMEQLEEVKVTASGYNAEFGGSMGGVVNVITRSGGNEFHGDVFGYYNNNQLWMQGKTRDYLRINPYWTTPLTKDWVEYVNNDDIYYNGGKDRDDYQRFEGVFNLGGYIIKDRLWFFGSFNPTYRQDLRRPLVHDRSGRPGQGQGPRRHESHDPQQGRQTYEFYQQEHVLLLAGQADRPALQGHARVPVAPSATSRSTSAARSPRSPARPTRTIRGTRDWTNTPS